MVFLLFKNIRHHGSPYSTEIQWPWLAPPKRWPPKEPNKWRRDGYQMQTENCIRTKNIAKRQWCAHLVDSNAISCFTIVWDHFCWNALDPSLNQWSHLNLFVTVNISCARARLHRACTTSTPCTCTLAPCAQAHQHSWQSVGETRLLTRNTFILFQNCSEIATLFMDFF